MKIDKILLIASIVIISLFAISAISAADVGDTDIDIASAEISEVSAVEDVQINDNYLDTKAKDVLSDGESPEAKEISLVTKDTPYNENVTIDISVANKESIGEGSNLKLFVDGVNQANLTLDSEGKASYIIPASTFEVGNYFVEAILDNGTDKLADRNVLNITKVTPVISVEDVTVKSGDIINIPFNVTDGNGKNIPGDVIVTIFWENDSLSKYFELTGNDSSSFDLASIIGLLGGNSTNSTGIAELLGGNGTNSTGIGGIFGGNGTNSTGIGGIFGGNGTNSTGIGGIFGGNSTNSSNSSGKSDIDLASILSLIMGGTTSGGDFAYVFEKGVYNVSVKYLANRNYNGAINDTAKLTITPMEDILINATVETAKNITDKTTASILLTDGYEKAIAGGQLKVSLNGEDKGTVTVNEEGKANITFENLLKGDYKLELSYNNTNKSFDFFVDVPRVVTAIDYEDMETTAVNTAVDNRTGEYFKITLKDADGNILANRSVQIGFNGKIYNKTTDKDGMAKLQINLPRSGIYTFAIAYLGDDSYNGTFAVAKITVNKQTAKLSSPNKSYKASAKTKTLTAKILSPKGNPIPNKKVTFIVNGKAYTAKTNDKGIASVNVSLNKAGTYKFTVKFAGDNTYNKLSTKATLTIK